MAQIHAFTEHRRTAGAMQRWLRALAQRGAFGDLCNNEACENKGAYWYSRASGQYYCDECARAINETCLMQGTRKICELRL